MQKVAYYDAKATTNKALQDKATYDPQNDTLTMTDTQGATITKGESTGTVLLDASGNAQNLSSKQSDTIASGHEVGEVKYLQNGNGIIFKDSHDTKEAMNDAYGAYYAQRLNEATNGGISDTPYATNTNTPSIQLGTNTANGIIIPENGVEYRQLATKEKDIVKTVAEKYGYDKAFVQAVAEGIVDMNAKIALNEKLSDLKAFADQPIGNGFIKANVGQNIYTEDNVKTVKALLLSEGTGQRFVDYNKGGSNKVFNPDHYQYTTKYDPNIKMKYVDATVSGAISIGGLFAAPEVALGLWGAGLTKDAYNTSQSDLAKDTIVNATGYPGLPSGVTNSNFVYSIFDVVGKFSDASKKYKEDEKSANKGAIK